MSGLKTLDAFNASGEVDDIAANSVALGTDTTGNYVATVAGGGGITVTGSGSETAAVTVAHTDTSSQSSVNNSGSTVIQDVTLDAYGHVTGLTSTTISTGGSAAHSGAVGTVLTMVGYNPGNVTLSSANPLVAGTSSAFDTSSPLVRNFSGTFGGVNSGHNALTGNWRPTNDHARYQGNTFTYDTWVRVS